ncbi:16S rRNA (guanine(527)-N(7))-methyltransferase RsmG [Haematobacter missouriensis]|uniref:Ribosomal RNA small subunit methyltransferase G n=2 Tax=Haematobacter missouriensis TaxID=366616 RepID=A0A212AM73_9RHOB|nr:16S rRNA (guanine(527)-N(7))-methyltransferase RsmG [Haematobacter missouriensis]OWJ73212.1 16S rRNA (guanine(527)-N(7))-methyltransferase RsmG [Haematobacter missouriensis]OWJ82608.1 16S rRNA (guanine(527)-N(7))-methyltransferase RsmG [Haematobacter missouriensis]
MKGIEFPDVSRETLERLEVYERLLRKWNPKINLVSTSTLDDLWGRHFRDSAQLLTFSRDFGAWVDLGSGGGFPGMVIAILGMGKDRSFTLVESDQRKAAFLSTVAREASVKVNVISQRSEAIPPLKADVVSARALAPLPRLLSMVERHLAQNGVALLPKGRGVEREIHEALEKFRFDVQKFPSETDPNGVILKIEGLSRV